jgi:hypothetical protein
MLAKVDEIVEGDSRGLQTVRDSIHQALEQSGLLQGTSEEAQNSYLDSLVEALAAELPGLKDIHEASEELLSDEQDEVEEADEGADQDAELSESTTKPASEKTEDNNDTPTEDSVEETAAEDSVKETSTENSVEETATEDSVDETGSDVSVEESTADVSVDETPVPNSDVLPETSLKDLIIKVAQNVENKANDLGVFEQVLSKLVTEANTEADDQEAETATANNATTTETVEEAESADEAPAATEGEKDYYGEKQELFGMYVTIQNRFEGRVVPRLNLSKSDPNYYAPRKWDLKYVVTELKDDAALRIYTQMKQRRRKTFYSDPGTRASTWHSMMGGQLPRKVDESKVWRGKQDTQDANKPVKVAWANEPLAASKG